MPSAGLAKLVWPAMVLAGLALGSFVVLSWPDTPTRNARLPYGESAPKTPPAIAATERMVGATPPAGAAPSLANAASQAPAPRTEAPDRVLAAVAPASSPPRGPRPITSQLERQRGYVQESPEALGAEPLPGTVLTPEAPPVAR